MEKQNTSLFTQVVILLAIAILLVVGTYFFPRVDLSVMNDQSVSQYLSLFAMVLTSIATYVSFKKATISKSSLFILMTVAFLALFFEHALTYFTQIGILSFPYVRVFALQGLQVTPLIVACLLITNTFLRPKNISGKREIGSVVSAYSGPVLVAILLYYTVLFINRDNPSTLTLMETIHTTGFYLVFILLGASLTFSLWQSFRGITTDMFFDVFAFLFLSSEVFIFRTHSVAEPYFHWANGILLLGYIVYVLSVFYRPKAREDINDSYRFTVASQLILTLVTLLGLLLISVLFLVSFGLTFQARLNPLSPGLAEYTRDPFTFLNFLQKTYRENLQYGLLMLIITASASTIYLLFSIVRIAHQFARLTETIKRVKEGDLGIDPELYGDDEFGFILQTLDDVTGQMKDAQRALEDKVRTRTKEYVTKVREVELQNKLLEKTERDLMFANEHIEEEKAKDEAMLVSIGDGIVVADQNGRVQRMNSSALAMLGWNLDEVIGKKVIEVVRMEDEKGNFIPLDKRPTALALRVGQKTLNQTYIFVRKNESKFPVGVSVTPITLSGKTIGAISVFRDITREKEIDKAKTEFVSLASHQLRTPLTTISWYTEALMQGKIGEINEKQREYLMEVYKGSGRLVDMVNSLLDVSRLELGTFAVDPVDTDIREIARSVVKELSPMRTEKQITLYEYYTDTMPPISLDPNLTRMILQNLISNAIKYTPESGIVVVQIEIKDDYVWIYVIDSGYGIADKDKSKIFTKLFRADATSKVAEGTGLGLYIIKSILEKTGGKIWFESPAPHRDDIPTREGFPGTVFYVTLPLSGMIRKEGSRRLGK